MVFATSPSLGDVRLIHPILLFDRRRATRSRHSGNMDTDDTSAPVLLRVATRLPAQDLERARRFYSEKLGLDPVDERPGGLLYRCGGAEFVLFRSTGSSPGTFTQMALEVEDIEAAVAELRRRGVVFEEVDAPGFRTQAGIAEIEGNYPSKGARGERGAWFRDSEGNLLGVGEPVL
jgi:catechol 2,3-dioxygenase-like lactoylglutathione lyase family enzyme